jgi:hypothetical protein
MSSCNSQRTFKLKGGGGQCTLYTPWEKKQLQKTKFTALMEKSPAANRKEMIQVQRTYPASNWRKESTVQPQKKKKTKSHEKSIACENPQTLKPVKDAETPIDYWNHNHDISPLNSSHAPKKKTRSLLVKKNCRVLASDLVKNHCKNHVAMRDNHIQLFACKILATFAFLVAVAPSLPREGLQEHHRTPPHTHASTNWRPRSDYIIKPTARIW